MTPASIQCHALTPVKYNHVNGPGYMTIVMEMYFSLRYYLYHNHLFLNLFYSTMIGIRWLDPNASTVRKNARDRWRSENEFSPSLIYYMLSKFKRECKYGFV